MRRYLINWLADGFHRYHATKRLYQKSIQADIRQGTRRDAVLFSVGANAQHGLKRTNADKRRAVETLLNDPEWAGWSNREIARRCAVDEGTVRNFRSNFTAEFPQLESRTYIDKHGTTTTMNTANIGHSSPPNVIAGFGRTLTELDPPPLPPTMHNKKTLSIDFPISQQIASLEIGAYAAWTGQVNNS